MKDTSKAFTKETGQIKTKRVFSMRKYDLLDLFSVGAYNLLIFSAGLGLGWFLWNVNS